jgi:chromosome segregation protein
VLKLQKVELLGFKSFADATQIEFHGAGIAAVVGPNGCGKSNISDAIHWVLGEQSAKTLRSSKMQDVLFNGTPQRKATGLAEVKLTLVDPEAKALAETIPLIAPGLHGAEDIAEGEQLSAAKSETEKLKSDGVITVARRLFASGESEYLMNDRACRLRDIQELFLGTGLGPDSYAIIEQGRIGQILSAKPYERRSLIEEAAGITKFKAKRKLAWAKLESSKQNLSRVSDILEEITRQVNSLQRQAAKARRYKELFDQTRAQLRAILVSKQRQKEDEATGLAIGLGELRRAVEEQSAQIELQERTQQEMHATLDLRQAELRDASEQRGNLQVSAERARGQVASQKQQLEYLGRRVEEVTAEDTQLQVRLESLQKERAESAAVLAGIEGDRDLLVAQLQDWEKRSRAAQSELNTRELRLEQIRLEMLTAVGECATLRNQVTQIEQFIERTTRQIAHAEHQAVELDALRQAAGGLRRDTDERVGQQRRERESLTARQKELEATLRSEREFEGQIRGDLERSRTELASERARLSSLKEILDRHSYATETVQRLFELKSADAEGKLRLESSGVLADFIEVEPAYERVVEEFLREELDYVVVNNWDAAERGLQLLRSEVPGRAAFIRNDQQVEAGTAALEDFAVTNQGILRPLASCVRFLSGFSSAPAGLLPKLQSSFLVADAEAGRMLAAKFPDKYFLTPDGISFQGAVVFAGKTDSQGPLALKRELRSLEREVEVHVEAESRLTGQLKAALGNIERQQAELTEVGLKERECERVLMHSERDLREAAEEESRVANRSELIALELQRLRTELDRARIQLATDGEQITQREKTRADLEAENTAIVAETIELKQQFEEARGLEADLRGRLVALEERRRASAATVSRLDQAVGEVATRREEILRQRESWAVQRTEIEAGNQRLEVEISQALERCEILGKQIEELQVASVELRQQIAALDQHLHDARQSLEATREKRNEAEVYMARLQSELDHLKETCHNELQLEMEALCAEAAAENLVLLQAEDLTLAEENWRQQKTRLENMGPINMMALEEYEEAKTRQTFLDQQRQDLLDSIRDTTLAIQEIDEICNRQFTEALGIIGAHFQETFTQLFGGGQGMLRLIQTEDMKDASEAGIEIVAQPPGKRLQSVLLLSGGEKALTAMALLLAIFKYKPSPFCILDEVDAPLDEANIGRFTQMVQLMSRDTQFILITHSKRTMSVASVLYGVTMQEPGVSKIVSVRFHQHALPAPPSSRLLAEAVA